MSTDPDLQPELAGTTLHLRPLRARDREALWEVARDPLVWEQHPDKTRFQPDGFARFFQDSLDSGSALVVIEAASGKIIGSARYYDLDTARREVAIGYTFLARAFWGGATNGELKQLMIGHAARIADRVWFHVGKHNLRSQRAMEKIGAKLEFEGPRPLNGEMIPFFYYRIDTAGW
jgi:RimJ/RimL family protein N-acetyltransferase